MKKDFEDSMRENTFHYLGKVNSGDEIKVENKQNLQENTTFQQNIREIIAERMKST